MIRVIAVLFAVFSFVFVGFVGAADAAKPGCKPPESYAVPSGSDVYVVEPGDTGWDLADVYHYDPTLWRRVVKDNAKLEEGWRWPKGRVGGQIVLVLCPGEPLVGLRTAGINPAGFKGGGTGGPGGVVDSGTALSQMRLISGATNLLPIEPRYGAFDQFVLGGWGQLLDFLLWAAATLAIASLISLVMLFLGGRRQRNAEPTEIPRVPGVRAEPVDPALAGQPFATLRMASDDIRPVEEIVAGMDAAANYLASRNFPPVAGTAAVARRAGEIERGRYYGEGEMGFNGGAPQALAVPENEPRRGFRALYEYPDDTRDYLITDQPCMNPVRTGRYYRGFTWIPEPVAEQRVAVPAPAPAPATTAVAAPAVQLATLTQKVPLWLVVRCGPDGTLSSAISGTRVDEGGEIVRVVSVKLPIRVAVQLDSQGRLGAAALGVGIHEAASTETASSAATAQTA